MVDETRVLRLLRAVADDLAVLRSAVAAGAEQLAELQDPADLERFSAAVAAWLAR